MRRRQREVGHHEKLRHENIVRLHAWVKTPARYYLVMEFCARGDLLAHVNDMAGRGGIKDDDVRSFFRQLMDGVAFCHALGVFHRDLKLENLMLCAPVAADGTPAPASAAARLAEAEPAAPVESTLQTAAVESNFGSDMDDAFMQGTMFSALAVEESPVESSPLSVEHVRPELNVADALTKGGDISVWDTGESAKLSYDRARGGLPTSSSLETVVSDNAAAIDNAWCVNMSEQPGTDSDGSDDTAGFKGVDVKKKKTGGTCRALSTLFKFAGAFIFGLIVASYLPSAGAAPVVSRGGLTFDADTSSTFTFSSDQVWVSGSQEHQECVLFDTSADRYKVPTVYKAPVSDTGASQSATGQRKLFPTAAIEERHPNVTVRVANGALLRPEFQGTMVLKCRSGKSSKKHVLLPVEKALYIPELGSLILVSPRTLFKLQGIRSYYNDEMFILLPNGYELPMVETSTGWSVDAAEFDATHLTAEQVKYSLDWVAAVNVSASGCVHSSVVKANLPTDVPFSTVHERCMHGSFERIVASDKCTRGLVVTGLVKPKDPCRHCIRGAAHKHTPQARAGKYTYIGQSVCSDAIKMPASTPFGFCAMVDFYDRATKFLAFYFLRSDTNEEMKRCFDLFVIDNKEYLRNGTVTEWYFDNHGQFISGNSELAIAALGTKVRSIVPYNPQMNPAERPWGDVLRGIRITLAAANVSEAMWPYPAIQYVFVHNALATRATTARALGMSPNQLRGLCGPAKLPGVTDLSHLGVVFCHADVLVRSKIGDFRYKLGKTKVPAAAKKAAKKPAKKASKS